MIDIEEEVFGIVSTKVRAQYPKIFMVGEYGRENADNRLHGESCGRDVRVKRLFQQDKG